MMASIERFRVLGFMGLVFAAACSSSSSDGNGSTSDAGPSAQTTCPVDSLPNPPAPATCTTAGGPSTGGTNAADHCMNGAARTAQDTAMCLSSVDAAAGDDDSGDDQADAGFVDDGRCGEGDYQPTIYGTSGADDDCKYDVSWTSTPICQGGPVYFTVVAKKRSAAGESSDTPLTGASVRIESYLNDCKTLGPNMVQTSVEGPAGTYKVGPIGFNKTGRWNVRFHFNECCTDIPEDSPHGHAAFWVDVP